jgi:AraC-like DNA-binding protein
VLLDALLSDLAVDVEPFALCQVSSGWRLRLPERGDASVHFVLEGRGAVRTPLGTRSVGPYWLVVVPPGTRHHLEAGVDPRRELRFDPQTEGGTPPLVVAGSEGDPALRVACGAIRVRYGVSLGLFDRLREVLAADLSAVPEARRAFEAILVEQARPGGSALAAALMTQCLVYLLRSVCGGPECTLPWLSALEDPRLARAIDRILARPEASHSVESLAMAASMSRSAFAEAFAAAFGRTPMALVHHVRMQRAFQLLARERSLSIDQVAERVGYASRSQFSRAFKRHHGTSPAACRGAARR